MSSFFKNISLNDHESNLSSRILEELEKRISYLKNVGLDYLTLSRSTATLSGGEYQRINLATSLGSNLRGTIYILDEPSVGLHPKDTHKLIKVIQDLKNKGNTVIIVEHDEEVMKAADQIIDIGKIRTIMYEKILADPQMISSLKADRQTEMAIITDIHQELREATALKLNYSAKPRE